MLFVFQIFILWTFKKNLSFKPSDCRTVWIHILSCLIWDLTVRKCYKQVLYIMGKEWRHTVWECGVFLIHLMLLKMNWGSCGSSFILGNYYYFKGTHGCFVCLFDLILYVPSTIFQLKRDISSWVEPVLS